VFYPAATFGGAEYLPAIHAYKLLVAVLAKPYRSGDHSFPFFSSG
tara:strand:+ start:129 stop:263 length:135 start_codon:yes stop_codon:yes gene_type:complete